ncbi:UNVERIFIED_CONTAM: MerR-like DNA binding protein [Acetivibrio alkalicellulosi]
MQLKEAIEETKLTKKAIRYYEECGLIELNKKDNGYKIYSDENVQKLKSIKKLRELGFSIEEIKCFFLSDTKKQEVIIQKMNETEKILTQYYMKKELFYALNDGKAIEDIYIEELKLKEERPYMYLQNIYTAFALINLISFVVIFLYFIIIKEHSSQQTGMLVIIQSVISLINLKFISRRERLKKQGINILEIKPKEIVFQYLTSIFSYGLSGALVNEALYFAKIYIGNRDYFSAIMNISMGVFFFGLSIVILVLSFYDSGET